MGVAYGTMYTLHTGSTPHLIIEVVVEIVPKQKVDEHSLHVWAGGVIIGSYFYLNATD